MADVGERAQLFLVGAFALAVLFVALAVLLNAAIFTENLSTQGAAPSPGDAVEYHEAAVNAGEGTVEGVNYHNNSTDYATLDEALRRGVGEWSNVTARHRASQGHAAKAAVIDTTNGTRLTQNGERNFSATTANWTLAQDVRVRNFTMNVSRSSLRDEPASQTPAGYESSDNLRVEFEDADGDFWTAYVHENSANNSVAVAVVDDTGSLSTCEAAASTVVIDFTAATVGGAYCEALDIYGAMAEPYTVGIGNATVGGSDTGRGTLSLVVDAPAGWQVNSGEFDGVEDRYSSLAIYAATVEVTYRASDTDYRGQVRVAPGEPDA